MREIPFAPPAKTLAMKRILGNSPLSVVRIAVIALLVGCGLLWWTGGVAQGIYADYQISTVLITKSMPASAANAKPAKSCLPTAKSLSATTAKLSKKSFSSSVWLPATATSLATVAADGGRPDGITLNLALEKTANRTLFAAFFAFLGLGCLWLSAYSLFCTLPRLRHLLDGINHSGAYPWKLVEIEAKTSGGKAASYRADIGGKPRRIILNSSRCLPFSMPSGNGKTIRILAFAPRHGGAPVPFDIELQTVEGLTDDERKMLVIQIAEAAYAA
ncbi:hypothetical protein [Kingella potus]|uniref:hypothetical protein n=1 Tax=Kingella potus TaxID=265175 RepID=UPI001FD6289C|nr:hypothetical protein [Kingella potus]UOP00253.1 hypothetical protein LVJ84_10035 [Kingella potus]